MPRFYVDLPLVLDETLELPAAAAHHALAVLRLDVGATLTLFNGQGGQYQARLTECAGKRASVRLEEFDPREAELPCAVTVAQGLPAGDKMDWIVEKSVELGAAAIQPLALERSIVRLTAERAHKRRLHWQAIAQAAAEQCGRNRVPSVTAPAGLRAWLEALPGDGTRLLAAPRAERHIASISRPEAGAKVLLVIGPEAGLAPDEETLLETAGFEPISLGPRVLRTETAALAALAMLGTLWAP